MFVMPSFGRTGKFYCFMLNVLYYSFQSYKLHGIENLWLRDVAICQDLF